MNSRGYPYNILLSVVWSGSNCNTWIQSHVSPLPTPTLQQLLKKEMTITLLLRSDPPYHTYIMAHNPSVHVELVIPECMFVCVGGFLYKLCGTVIAFGSTGNSFKYIRKKNE